MTGKKIRRDVLKRMVEKGELEARSFNLGNNFEGSKCYAPARIQKDIAKDFKQGYMNFLDFDFKSKVGYASEDSKDHYTLSVHSNQWYELRKKTKTPCKVE